MTYAVTDPATGLVMKQYPTIDDDTLAVAITEATAAQAEWARTATIAQRAALVGAVAELHAERAQELAQIAVREVGKPLDQAVGEVEFAAAIYAYYAENAEVFLADEPIELSGGTGTAVVRTAPVGVLLGIMPWNFPYYQVARFAGPNLCVGNTVILKHAPQCPESAEAIAEIFAAAAERVGAPVGVYRNVRASDAQVAQIIADPRVQGVSVTGSERAGAAVAEIAGRNLKKVVLELGGSDPFIVLSTDDLDAVVEDAVNARLDNAGQSCNAAKRFIVVDSLYDEFARRFVERMAAVHPGEPLAEGTVLGPLSSTAAADRLQDQVGRALQEGATALLHGDRVGNFVAPTVLAGITSAMGAYREEFFGPVAALYRVADEDEAVAIANDTPFGLGSYLYTTDSEQAQRVADRIDAGMVYVNIVLADAPELPFGGIKRSGSGRELGRWGVGEFVNRKLIRVG